HDRELHRGCGDGWRQSGAGGRAVRRLAEERAVMGETEAVCKQIDLIDAKLVELLNARAACAVEIGRLKELAGLPVYQPAREAEGLADVREGDNRALEHAARTPVFA